jgi:Rac GTPase-activating protein 1
MEVVSGQRVIATTTVTVAHSGPVTASAKLEAEKPGPSRPAPSAPPMPVESEGSSEDSFWQRNKGVPGLGGGGDVQPQMSVPTTMNRINTRVHVFCTKNIIRPESCGPCGRKIKFAAKVMKCVDCRAVCHPECKDDVPLPCVPMGTTPSKKMVHITS